MCGIAGLLVLDGSGPPDALALDAMAEALRHRGPDQGGTVVDGPAGLAARRLAIIDVAGGDQPRSNEDGSVHVVHNGEVYDHAEHAADLRRRGHVLQGRGDTEALVHLYEEHGLDFARRLRGMFAIAIWDRPRRRLVLARDPFGIKPLYWAEHDGLLAFASELTALQRRPGARDDVDPAALDALLAFNSIPGPLSILRDARKLPPGHLLVAEDGRVRVEPYARPRAVRAGAERRESPRALAADLRGRLRDSVRAHLVADVPVGVLLSGGIDSGTLCALAAQEAGAQVKTFSVGFHERSFDELEHARLVAQRYGTDHHEVVLEPDPELVLRAMRAFDEPLGDSSLLPSFAVAELARKHVKVVLSGEGGDELFGGYETYVADLLAPRVAPFAGALGLVARRLPSSEGRVPLDYKLKRFSAGAQLGPLERHHAWKEIFSPDVRAELLGGPSGADPVDALRARWAQTEGCAPLSRVQDLDLGVPLVDDLLVKTDRATMAHSLEARVPLLDRVVAELAFALPTHLKVRGTTKKRLLRMAAAPWLPPELLKARKRGFSIPAAAWLRGPLRELATDLLAPAELRRHGLLEPRAVERVLARHQSGAEDLSRQLWGLLALSVWCDAQARARTGAVG